jgi:hypothetical protein
VITLEGGRKGKISSSTDEDWYSITNYGSNVTTNTKIRVDLVNIPAGKDYDIRVYKQDGTTSLGSGISINTNGQNYETVIFTVPFVTETSPATGATYTSPQTVCIKVNSTGAPNTSAEYIISATKTTEALANWAYPFRTATLHQRILQNYGHYDDNSGNHYGLDVKGPSGTTGTTVYSVSTGKVIASSSNASRGTYVTVGIEWFV